MPTQEIKDRVEEILANCGHEVDDDKTALLEQIIDDKEIIGLIMDLAWLCVPKQGLDSIPFATVRCMARIANSMALRMQKLAEEMAEGEQE